LFYGHAMRIAVFANDEYHDKRSRISCRRRGISVPTFYAWKAKFGGMSISAWDTIQYKPGPHLRPRIRG